MDKPIEEEYKEEDKVRVFKCLEPAVFPAESEIFQSVWNLPRVDVFGLTQSQPL